MEIKEYIENKASELNKEIEELKKSDKINSTNLYPIVSYIFVKDDDLNKLEEREWDKENIYYVYKKFMDIFYQLNKETLIVPSKELFCQFIGWNSYFYGENLNNGTDEIKQVMKMVEGYLIDSELNAAVMGYTKANPSKFRLQNAGDFGHSQITQKEQNADNRAGNKMKSITELEKELKKLNNNGWQYEK